MYETITIVVTGAVEADKRAFVEALHMPERPARSSAKTDSSAAMAFGRVPIDETMQVYLTATPAVFTPQTEWVWETQAEAMHGIIVLLDALRPDKIGIAAAYLGTLRNYAPVPFLVAVTNAENPEAVSTEKIRAGLIVPDTTKILPCQLDAPDAIRAAIDTMLALIRDETH
jgi:signal recognition particle receptor subunit beta